MDFGINLASAISLPTDFNAIPIHSAVQIVMLLKQSSGYLADRRSLILQTPYHVPTLLFNQSAAPEGLDLAWSEDLIIEELQESKDVVVGLKDFHAASIPYDNQRDSRDFEHLKREAINRDSQNAYSGSDW